MFQPEIRNSTLLDAICTSIYKEELLSYLNIFYEHKDLIKDKDFHIFTFNDVIQYEHVQCILNLNHMLTVHFNFGLFNPMDTVNKLVPAIFTFEPNKIKPAIYQCRKELSGIPVFYNSNINLIEK